MRIKDRRGAIAPTWPLVIFLAATSTIAAADRIGPPEVEPAVEPSPSPPQMRPPPLTFAFDGAAIGTDGPSAEVAEYLAGSRIVAVDDDALVIDADSGSLILTNKRDTAAATVAIGADAGQLVYDPIGHRAYVADRRGDRIVIVAVNPTAKSASTRLTVLATIATAAEPFGLALSPKRDQLFVTCVADRTLIAYPLPADISRETAVKEAWRHPVAPDPRGVAVSPDGKYALVTSLLSGAVERVSLADHASLPIALPVDNAPSSPPPVTPPPENGPNVAPQIASIPSLQSFARADFAVRYIGHDLAVTAYQRETPVQTLTDSNSGGYGGGFSPPIEGFMMFVAAQSSLPKNVGALVHLQQPQAIAWSSTHDALYVAGYGNDMIARISNASQSSPTFGGFIDVSGKHDGDACGPQGLAMSRDGHVLIWCALSRSVIRVDVDDAHSDGSALVLPSITRGGSLVVSRYSKAQHRGLDLFRRGNDLRISSAGAMACAGCHPEGRADGLTWRIEDHTLQTPLLAGRVDGTHPYKWDGSDKTLDDSFVSTTKRLGGAGMVPADRKALAAYLTSLPAPRTPTHDAAAVKRGEALFASADLGCASCHQGAHLTNNKRYELGSPELPSVDTPSLIGVGASAPYYHDGSAPTLAALLHGEGSVHGMAEFGGLDDHKVADLVAYLETR